MNEELYELLETEFLKYRIDEEAVSYTHLLSLKKVPRHTMVFEIEGPVFFATIDDFMNITAGKTTKVVILRMRSVPSIDITAIHNMEKLLERCEKKKITLLLSHVNEYPYSVMKRAGFVEKLGEENFCSNIDSALKKAEGLVS